MHSTSSFLATILIVSCLYFFLNPAPTQAQPTVTLPAATDCLYFTDQNGIAEVLRYTTVDANGTTLPQGELVQVIQNVGYLPVAMVFHYNTLFIASKRQIASFDVSDNLKRGRIFVDLAFSQNYTCEPGGMVIADDALWLSCYRGDPHAIIKYSLRPEDWGAFLVGSGPGLFDIYSYGFSNMYQVQGTFSVQPYNSTTFVNVTGSFAFLNDFYGLSISLIDLSSSNRTTPVAIQDVYTWRSIYYLDIANASFTSWYQTTYGPDNNLYVARTYSVGLTSWSVGDISVYSGYDGTYIRQLVPQASELASASGITFGPDGLLYLSVGNLIGVSYIFVYDPNTGEKLGTFFQGTLDNDVIPQFLYWYTCPYSPESSSGVDTTTVVLATVLPVVAAMLLCLICCLLVLLLFLVISRYLSTRRRVYSVRDEDDGLEMGRYGKTNFSYREIDPAELEIGALLGEGAFGKVYKGTYRGAQVAIKTFDQIKLDEADEQTLAEIREEAQMMERLGNHPNVISFVGAITSPSSKGHQLHFSLVTEYCPNGSLFDFLVKKKTRLPLIVLIKMARDIAAGILHLHREKVIHRDIAARNILVGNNYAVFISDFGMARIKQQDVNTTIANVGPVKWMAPECMTHKQYSEASDAFAYGVLLWEMITRQIPWKGMDATQVIIAVSRKNTRLEVPTDADPVLKKIIKAVWRENPEKRMTMAAIVSKLDTYLKTLEEMYENISSDEDDTASRSEREFYKVDSDESRKHLTSNSHARPIRRGGPESKTEMPEEDDDFEVASDYSSMDEKPSAEPLKKGGKKGGGKGGNGGSRVEVAKNYGEIPAGMGGGQNYGEIPEMPDKEYGEIPASLDDNYGNLPKNKKK